MKPKKPLSPAALEQRRAAAKKPRTMTEKAIEQRTNAGKGNRSETPHRVTLWREKKRQDQSPVRKSQVP